AGGPHRLRTRRGPRAGLGGGFRLSHREAGESRRAARARRAAWDGGSAEAADRSLSRAPKTTGLTHAASLCWRAGNQQVAARLLPAFGTLAERGSFRLPRALSTPAPRSRARVTAGVSPTTVPVAATVGPVSAGRRWSSVGSSGRRP